MRSALDILNEWDARSINRGVYPFWTEQGKKDMLHLIAVELDEKKILAESYASLLQAGRDWLRDLNDHEPCGGCGECSTCTLAALIEDTPAKEE